MPAAAVIPAPRAYINVVAVKKPVVGFEDIASGSCLSSSRDKDHISVFYDMRERLSAKRLCFGMPCGAFGVTTLL